MQTTLEKEFLLIDHQGRSLFDCIFRWFNTEFPTFLTLQHTNANLYLTVAHLTFRLIFIFIV